MRRLSFAALFSLLALALVAGPVAAGKPDKEYLPSDPFFDFAAGELCAFPVRIAVDINQEYGKTFFDGDTPVRTIVNGRLVLTVSNLADPDHSMTVNASGPGVVEYLANGDIRVTLRGRAMVWLPSDHLFFLNSGWVIEQGNGTIQPVVLPVVDETGHHVDMCPLLAG